MVLIYIQRSVDRTQQRIAAEIHESKAGSFTRISIVRDNRILQTARLVHDRQSAVAQRNHLRQAAWFECGRHQEQIRACVHLLRQGDVKIDDRRETIRIFGSKVTE
ncbi:hypothetical protein SDC9_114130 [bioreactor metagenome]|uniref:Uncharacterized protein n=1 Tax=bioreactor metagenome TaxID=1076179 RepID=A0A645BVG7_9ZZZZ